MSPRGIPLRKGPLPAGGSPPKSLTPSAPKPLPRAIYVFQPRVTALLEEMVAVHDYLTRHGLPPDLVSALVLHHQRFYLERL